MEQWRGCSENSLESDKRSNPPILITILSLLVVSNCLVLPSFDYVVAKSTFLRSVHIRFEILG